jgi:murein hydrolase activator
LKTPKSNIMGKQFKVINYFFCRRFVFVFIVIALNTGISSAQNDKSTLQENKKKIEQEIQYTNNLLNETKKNKQTSLNQLVILKNQINKREELIGNINQELNVIGTEITVTQKTVEQLSQELANLKAEYAQMIIAANKNRSSYNVMMFIFASDNFNQAYQRLKYYQQYAAYRKKQMILIQETQDKLTHKKHELENQQQSQQILLNSNENEKKKLNQEKEIKNKAVKNLQQKEKELLKTLRKKEAEARKLQKDIERIIAEEVRKAREAAVQRAEKAEKAKKKAVKPDVTTAKEIEKSKVVEEKFKKTADIMSATPEELELSASFTNNKGRLPWPLEKGIISGTFGKHSHPELHGIEINNDGIDITTNRGSAARAVFNGEVTAVIAGPNGKQVVIIRHGNYLTVYSNLENVSVRRGEKISTKQRIGKVYTDDDDNKTILQFQIWKGTTKMNPSEWIAR